MLTVPMSARIASTAAPSPPFLSPRPTQRPAAIAPASVTRTSSRARLRSGAGRSARKVLVRLVELGCPSGSGRDNRTSRLGPLPGTLPGSEGASDARSGDDGGRAGELCCDPRGMTGAGPSDQEQQTVPEEERPPPVSAVERANRMSAGNMLRSLAPLVLICLAAVGWLAFLRDDEQDPSRRSTPWAPSGGRPSTPPTTWRPRPTCPRATGSTTPTSPGVPAARSRWASTTCRRPTSTSAS